jgi:hypothetical protein
LNIIHLQRAVTNNTAEILQPLKKSTWHPMKKAFNKNGAFYAFKIHINTILPFMPMSESTSDNKTLTANDAITYKVYRKFQLSSKNMK